MIVQDTKALAAKIKASFEAIYKPSNVVRLKKTDWKDQRLDRVFSDDFLTVALPHILSRVAQVDMTAEGAIQFRLPDDLEDMVHQFVLQHDSQVGYNGTKEDLKLAENQFVGTLSFAVNDEEMKRRVDACTVPEKDDKEWGESMRSYTMAPRPRFDHFSSTDQEAYEKEKQTVAFDIRTNRVVVATGRQDTQDAVRFDQSELAHCYFLDDVNRQSTSGTVSSIFDDTYGTCHAYSHNILDLHCNNANSKPN